MLPDRSRLLPPKLPAGKKGCEVLTDGRQPDTHAHCQGCHLSGARAESKTDVGLGEGMTWVPRHRQCPVGAGAPAHSSFLAGTRVRAMMMGTRARQLMTSAHRGR